VSRWDTGSRDTSSRGRSRGSDSDRDWESEERGHRGGREVPTSSVFLKVLQAVATVLQPPQALRVQP
jgi:hypothetical protein